MKSFREFTNTNLEERFLKKGIAIAQVAKHKSATSKIQSTTTSILQNAQQALRTDEIAEKIDLLLHNQIKIAELHIQQNIQSTTLMTTLTANTLLQESIQKEVHKALKEKK